MGFQHMERGFDYVHGEDLSLESYYMGTFRHDAESLTDWNATKDGSIICALKEMDGCGGSLLQLKHILPEDRTLDLKERAKQVMMKFGIEQARNSPTSRSDQSCSLGVQLSDASFSSQWQQRLFLQESEKKKKEFIFKT